VLTCVRQSYWDWTLDASGMIDSPIWSVDSGFGGNGSDPDGCLKDGPFKNMTPQFPEPHCLKRQFAARNMDARNYTIEIIEDIMSTAQQTYHDFRDGLENGPHKWLHKGIGGGMPSPSSVNGTCTLC
jgi:tyrosinase